MYFIVLKYRGFLGGYPLLEQDCRTRNDNTSPLILGWSLRDFKKILILLWQRLQDYSKI